jgi:hypothetical protein
MKYLRLQIKNIITHIKNIKEQKQIATKIKLLDINTNIDDIKLRYLNIIISFILYKLNTIFLYYFKSSYAFYYLKLNI